MSTTTKFPVIPSGAIIKLEVSGYFYTQLSYMLLQLSSGKEAEFSKALDKLKANIAPDTDYEFHIQTLVTLIYEIEKKAQDQGLVVEKEIESNSEEK